MSHDPVADVHAVLSALKNANGRVVFTGEDLTRLRRVLRTHERCAKAHTCPCCRRLLHISEREPICEECGCGAHQDEGCVHKGEVARECRECGEDFWIEEAKFKARPADIRMTCEKCLKEVGHP